MLQTWLIAGLIGLVIGVVASLIALGIQRRIHNKADAQQQAWERAQEIRLQHWREQQEKLVVEVEGKLTAEVEQLRTAWDAWESHDVERAEMLEQQYKAALGRASVEHEITHLQPLEETPLEEIAYHRPAHLRGVNLVQRDLSRRSMRHADLRDAQLINANLFMSDLSSASLVGANLAGANLAGANLTNTDLRGAVLVGANLLVADLHHANLIGANLSGVRSLTSNQLITALYDESTRFDPNLELTLPRLPRVMQEKPDADLSAYTPSQPTTNGMAINATPLLTIKELPELSDSGLSRESS